MNDTPQNTTITAEQVRVAAQVGIQLLSSETSSVPTAHMNAALILRQLLVAIAEGQAVIAPVAPVAPIAPETPEPPAPEDGAEDQDPVQSEG